MNEKSSSGKKRTMEKMETTSATAARLPLTRQEEVYLRTALTLVVAKRRLQSKEPRTLLDDNHLNQSDNSSWLPVPKIQPHDHLWSMFQAAVTTIKAGGDCAGIAAHLANHAESWIPKVISSPKRCSLEDTVHVEVLEKIIQASTHTYRESWARMLCERIEGVLKSRDSDIDAISANLLRLMRSTQCIPDLLVDPIPLQDLAKACVQGQKTGSQLLLCMGLYRMLAEASLPSEY